MNILVTGGTGMVGSCIQDCVQQNPEFQDNTYHYLSSRECDLRDYHKTLEFFKNNLFDVVIHLVANVGDLFKNMKYNYTMLQDNLTINTNVVKCCVQTGIKKGVFILSSCIFPENPSYYPMTENMLHSSQPHSSNEGYNIAKRVLEVQCRLSNKDNNTQFVCLTPVNLYGPHDNFDPKNSHVISGLMQRFYKEKNTNDRLYIAYGTGKPLRQFLYAPDFAKIILTVLTKLKQNNMPLEHHMICCTDEVFTLTKTVYLLCKVMNIDKKKVLFDTSWSDGCMRKTVSNLKLKIVFPNLSFTSLEEGLHNSYGWYIKNLQPTHSKQVMNS